MFKGDAAKEGEALRNTAAAAISPRNGETGGLLDCLQLMGKRRVLDVETEKLGGVDKNLLEN